MLSMIKVLHPPNILKYIDYINIVKTGIDSECFVNAKRSMMR